MQFNISESTIYMPNEIFIDLKNWTKEKDIKSIQHQEFIYTYYWLLAYLWRYAQYSEQKITQSDIKQALGYNPEEKRLNYIMKKGGLLDEKDYSLATNNFPVNWNFANREELSFDMLYDFNEDERKYLLKYDSNRYIVKEPIKFTGSDDEEGVYWNVSNTHMMRGDLLLNCIENGYSCAPFYLYGILTFIRDKSDSVEFPCANDTLREYTGWNERKVIKITNTLMDLGFIQKEQKNKQKGAVNYYILAV